MVAGVGLLVWSVARKKRGERTGGLCLGGESGETRGGGRREIANGGRVVGAIAGGGTRVPASCLARGEDRAWPCACAGPHRNEDWPPRPGRAGARGGKAIGTPAAAGESAPAWARGDGRAWQRRFPLSMSTRPLLPGTSWIWDQGVPAGRGAGCRSEGGAPHKNTRRRRSANQSLSLSLPRPARGGRGGAGSPPHPLRETGQVVGQGVGRVRGGGRRGDGACSPRKQKNRASEGRRQGRPPPPLSVSPRAPAPRCSLTLSSGGGCARPPTRILNIVPL